MTNSLKVPKLGAAAALLEQLNAEHAPSPTDVPEDQAPGAERAPAPTAPGNDAQMRKGADAQTRKQAGTHASKRVSKEASAQVRERVSEHPVPPAAEMVLPETEEASWSIEDRVNEMLAARRHHAGGTKLSVDLDPELDARIKMYCLTNGKITTRQLFIEVVLAFLEKEGY